MEIIQQGISLAFLAFFLAYLVPPAAHQPHLVQQEEEGVEDDQEDSDTTNHK